jgi:hypothetical protein
VPEAKAAAKAFKGMQGKLLVVMDDGDRLIAEEA